MSEQPKSELIVLFFSETFEFSFYIDCLVILVKLSQIQPFCSEIKVKKYDEKEKVFQNFGPTHTYPVLAC